ncbi:MAG: hypothetical protein ACKN9R_05175 [Candidatus Limnocylindrus sp.]
MKVNRKSTPKMVVRPHFSDYERLQRKEESQSRMLFTSLMMAAWVFVMLVWSWFR